MFCTSPVPPLVLQSYQKSKKKICAGVLCNNCCLLHSMVTSHIFLDRLDLRYMSPNGALICILFAFCENSKYQGIDMYNSSSTQTQAPAACMLHVVWINPKMVCGTGNGRMASKAACGGAIKLYKQYTCNVCKAHC